MTIDATTVCQEICGRLTSTLACAVVDLTSGLLIASYEAERGLAAGYLDTLAAVSVDLFRGRNIRRLEDLLSRTRSRPVREMMDEMFWGTPEVNYYFKSMKDKQALLVCLVPVSVNQGLAWSVVRGSISEVKTTL